jgi:hypothetical protein
MMVYPVDANYEPEKSKVVIWRNGLLVGEISITALLAMVGDEKMKPYQDAFRLGYEACLLRGDSV